MSLTYKATAPKQLDPTSSVATIKTFIKQTPIVVFAKSYCPYCTQAIRTLRSFARRHNVTMHVIMLDTVVPEKKAMLLHKKIIRMTNRQTVPNVFIGGQSVGGGDEIEALRSKRQLGALIKASNAKGHTTNRHSKRQQKSSSSKILSNFETKRILMGGDLGGNRHVILGTLPDEETLHHRTPAIVIIQQQDFTSSDILKVLSNFATHQTMHLVMKNNEYKYYETDYPAASGKLGIEIIHPCTSWHVNKYTFKPMFLIEETSDDFNLITQPYIDTLPAKKLQWLFDILDGKKEAERVLVSDPDPDNGFVLVMQPSMKNHDDKQNVYYCAFTRTRDLRSLRDLDASHLPMLTNIRTKSLKALEHQYGMTSVDLRIYFHYQPSFFHLHIHFRALTRVQDPTKLGGREILLDDVINNLQIDSDYYKKCTLTFASATHPKLTQCFHLAKLNSMAKEKDTIDTMKPRLKLLVFDINILQSFIEEDEHNANMFIEFIFSNFKVACLDTHSKTKPCVALNPNRFVFCSSGAKLIENIQKTHQHSSLSVSFNKKNTLCIVQSKLKHNHSVLKDFCTISPPNNRLKFDMHELCHFLWSMYHATDIQHFVKCRNVWT